MTPNIKKSSKFINPATKVPSSYPNWQSLKKLDKFQMKDYGLFIGKSD